jgi:negative modulator of initiation of replication
MKTLQVEDDIYNHLLQNVTFIGEDASSILRRLLRIGTERQAVREHRSKHQGPTVNGDGPSSVDECIQHHRFQTEREAVGKFLFSLSWLAQKHGEDFRKVLDIQGRKRRYFAESREAIEESGSSVMPQEIPNTGFWVATNNDTPKKQRMLRDVLQVMGYSVGDCNRLTDALGD